MTFTIKHVFVNKHYIEISQDKYSNAYIVTMSHCHGDNDLYYVDCKNIYGTLKAANSRFNYLKRTLRKGVNNG